MKKNYKKVKGKGWRRRQSIVSTAIREIMKEMVKEKREREKEKVKGQKIKKMLEGIKIKDGPEEKR